MFLSVVQGVLSVVQGVLSVVQGVPHQIGLFLPFRWDFENKRFIGHSNLRFKAG